MRLATWFVLLGTVFVSACASGPPVGPTGEPLSSSDFGSPPDSAEAVVRAFLRSKLKDPSSAQVEVLAGPRQLTVKGSVFGPSAYGWGICYELNAKNSFGAYTGYRKQALIWRDGRVVREFGTTTEGMLDAASAVAACNNLLGR